MKRSVITTLTPMLLVALLLAGIEVAAASAMPKLIRDDIPELPQTSSVYLGDDHDGERALDIATVAPSSLPSHTYPLVDRPSPIVAAWMDSISSDDVVEYVGGLSGERPVLIGGQPYTIRSRMTGSGEPISKAIQYVGEHMADLGLGVEYHDWGPTSPPNVIGQLTGVNDPEKIFIISAHLDDLAITFGDVAPGADDNASGTTAVLLAADTLSPYQWGCTLRFTLWTGEEQGLHGSSAYARDAYANDETIFGVMNFDMIGWNTPGSPRDIDIHASTAVTNSVELAELFADVIQVYQLDLIPEIVADGTGRSDHASFWSQGYPAILGIEDYFPGRHDFNPHYHTIEDRLEYLDIDYFTRFVRAALGGLVHMSDCLIVGSLDGTVRSEAGTPVGNVSVSAVSAAGHRFTAASDANGYYTLTLPVAVYTVTAEATGFLKSSVADVDVMADVPSTQDFTVAPEPARAEVAVEKRLDAFDPIREQQTFDFIVTVTNTGNVTLTNLPLVDTYDTNYLRYLHSQPPSLDSEDDGLIEWESLSPSLSPGASVTVTTHFLAQAETGAVQPRGDTENSAAVSQASGDPDGDGPQPPLVAPSRLATATVRILTASAVDVTATNLLDQGGLIILQWQSVDETGLVGFHVVRQTEGDELVTSERIEAKSAGKPQSNLYTYADDVEGRRVDFHYSLQVVASDGTVATVPLGTAYRYPEIFLPVITK